MKKISLCRKISIAVVLLVIFFIMLFCNHFTLYCADDYNYKYNFKTGKMISSLTEIPESMAAHAISMNGRLFAHSIVQIFDFFPKSIFNLANALVFTLLIYSIYHISAGESVNCFLLILTFCMVWIFTPVFGQVFLWLDGSINYSWGSLFALIYINYFYSAFIHKRQHNTVFEKIFLIVLGFFVGGYLENISVATIFITASFTIIILFKKQRIGWQYVCAIIASVIGLILMAACPAELYKGAHSFDRYIFNLESIINVLKLLFIPLLAFGFSVIILYSINPAFLKNNRVVSAFLFFASALVANFTMLLSRVYPLRCSLFVVLLMIVSLMILFDELWKTSYKSLVVCSFFTLNLITFYLGFYGCKDILRTYELMSYNNSILEKEKGSDEQVKLIVVHPETKYSCIYDLKYIDTYDPQTYPNDYIAKYYNVPSVIGVEDSDKEAKIMHSKLFGE